MGIITLQLGQCGNEIGTSFYVSLAEELSRSAQKCGVSATANKDFVEQGSERFFRFGEHARRNQCQPRAVLVDMEHKVVDKILRESGTLRRAANGLPDFSWSFDEKNCVCEKKGAGNNWAMGFVEWGPKNADVVLDLIRKEVELCDSFEGFLLLLSLAGGTGSGVGAFYSQALREKYPNATQLVCVVWPFSSGEVCVQNYNALLTLSRLQTYSSAIIGMENDQLQKICTKNYGILDAKFQDINCIIGQKLCSLFLPSISGTSSGTSLNALINHLVPQSLQFKLLTVRNMPMVAPSAVAYTTYNWTSLLKHTRQMIIADAHIDQGIDWEVRLDCRTSSAKIVNKSLANLLILRGSGYKDADLSSWNDPKMYAVEQVGDSEPFQCWKSARFFGGHEMSAALISNSQSLTQPLDAIVDSAWKMFHNKAFLHHYKQYGWGEEEFLQSFAVVEKIIQSYKDLY